MKLGCHTKDLPNCVLLISSHCGPPGSAGKHGGESGLSAWFQGLDKASGNLSTSPQKWSLILSTLLRVVPRAWSHWVLCYLCEGRFGVFCGESTHSDSQAVCYGMKKFSLRKELLSTEKKTQGSSQYLEETNKFSLYELLQSSLKDISPKVITQTTF